MAAWIKAYFAIRMGTLSLAAVTLCAALDGQQRPLNFSGNSGIGSTVNVADLKVPEKAWRHFQSARASMDHDRLTEADIESQKAIAVYPDFAQAHLLRASVQIQQHRLVAAIASVAEARRIEPDPLWAGVLLASAYNGLQRYSEASDILDGLHPEEANSWQTAYERARASIGLRDIPAALHWSAVALTAAPDKFTDTLLVRANSLVLAGRWSDAATQLERYLRAHDPQARRPDVLAALESDRKHAQEEELQRLASR